MYVCVYVSDLIITGHFFYSFSSIFPNLTEKI